MALTPNLHVNQRPQADISARFYPKGANQPFIALDIDYITYFFSVEQFTLLRDVLNTLHEKHAAAFAPPDPQPIAEVLAESAPDEAGGILHPEELVVQALGESVSRIAFVDGEGFQAVLANGTVREATTEEVDAEWPF